MDFRRITLGLVASCAWVTVAAAETMLCDFTLECYDTEACAETTFDVTFSPLEDRFLMSSIAGERTFEFLGEDGDANAFVSGATNGTVALLTVTPNGVVILTEHALFMPAYRVSYHGACRIEEG